MADLEDILVKISVNATKWADYWSKFDVVSDKEKMYAKALGRVQNRIIATISSSIKEAISGHPEYSRYGWMQAELITAFNNPDVIRIDPNTGVVDLFTGANEEVGDWEKFWEGYALALAEVSPGAEKATPETRRRIWKEFVWPNDYQLSRTLSKRRQAWGDKKPWWLWLEYGNDGLEGAWPENFPATGFLFKAQYNAREIFNRALEMVQNERSTLVTDNFQRYADNPDTFGPYDVLEEFYADGKEYVVYITPKLKLLGVTEARRIR